MDRTVPPTDVQAKASTGEHWQVGMPFLAVVRDEQLLPQQLLDRLTFNGCLTEAARHSGLDDQEIAEAIHISPGYMSRFMRGVAQQWAKRLVAFMRATRSLAPLQWIAQQMGAEVVLRDRRAAEVAELRARLMQLQGDRA